MHEFNLGFRWWYVAYNDGYPALPVAHDVASSLTVGDNDSPADGEPNVAFRLQASIASSGTQTLDLYQVQNALGATVDVAEIHSVIVTCDTAGGKGNVQKGASDAWTGLGTTPVIPFDAKFPFLVGSSAGIAVSNTDKNIKITNNGASTSTYTVYILARA